MVSPKAKHPYILRWDFSQGPRPSYGTAADGEVLSRTHGRSRQGRKWRAEPTAAGNSPIAQATHCTVAGQTGTRRHPNPQRARRCPIPRRMRCVVTLGRPLEMRVPDRDWRSNADTRWYLRTVLRCYALAGGTRNTNVAAVPLAKIRSRQA
jgi:hypothetical protein